MAPKLASEPPRAATLTVINPSGQRTRVSIGTAPVQFGRQSDNQVVLRDNRVSRVHGQIFFDDGDFHVEDLNSRHGLFVNGDRIDGKQRLLHSDSISFGFPDGYQIIFQHDERELGKLVDHVAQATRSTDSMSGNLAKLRALVEVARTLQSSLSINEVLESIVDAALNVTGAERGFLLLRQGHELSVTVARDSLGNPLRPGDLSVPATLIKTALETRRELLAMNFDPTRATSAVDTSVEKLELRSAMCVPLVRVRTDVMNETVVSTANDTVGLIYLDSRLDAHDLAGGNQEILQTLALEASTVLENARLLEQERAKIRMEDELRIARVIQQGLLPRTLPSTGWFRVAGRSIASQQVGGDYYDVAQPASGYWALVVADVSGKGVSSALLASLLQGAFLAGAVAPGQIEAMLARINLYLYERTEGEKYATVFYAAIRSDGEIHWSNAGHCSPMLVHPNGEIESWRPTAMPVGILDFGDFEVSTAMLQPGDKIVVFSDGVSEAQNAAGEFFEIERIRSIVRDNAASSATALHDALVHAVEMFTNGQPQRDDMTLVVAEYQPGS